MSNTAVVGVGSAPDTFLNSINVIPKLKFKRVPFFNLDSPCTNGLKSIFKIESEIVELEDVGVYVN